VEPESIPSKHKPVLRRSSNRFGPYNVVQPITKVKRKFNDQDDIDNSEMTDCESNIVGDKRRRYLRGSINETSKTIGNV